MEERGGEENGQQMAEQEESTRKSADSGEKSGNTGRGTVSLAGCRTSFSQAINRAVCVPDMEKSRLQFSICVLKM